VADELDGAEELMRTLEDAEFRNAVKQYPALLGEVIDDIGVREALAGSRSARKRVCRALVPPTQKDAKSAPAEGEGPDPELLARSRDAILAVAEGESPIVKVPQAADADGEAAVNIRGNALLLEAAFEEWIGGNRGVTAILRRMHKEEMPAICLSGGGIRSATFNLGVIQALARRGVLAQFKYISTVSGGGYIGAWLSSWIRRHAEGAEGAMRDLAAGTGDPVEPEPKPMRHLRDYSRYLAPRAGLFRVDLWTIVAIYVRNLLLNWTLLLPPLFALLLFPRAAERLLMKEPFLNPVQWLAISWILLTVAMVLFGDARPQVQVVTGEPPDVVTLRRERRRTMWKLSPLVLSAVLLALGVGWHFVALRTGRAASEWGQVNLTRLGPLFIVANLLGALRYVYLYGRALLKYDDRELNRWYHNDNYLRAIFRAGWPRFLTEIVGALGAAFAAWGILAGVALFADGNAGVVGAEVFVCFSVPVILAIFVAEGAVLLGVTTVFSSEHEREWVARAAAGVMLFGLGWIFLTATVLFVPIALYQSPAIVSALGGLAGISALITGKSAKTAANVTTRETTSVGRSFSLIIGAAATVCLMVIGGVVSIVTTEILNWNAVRGATVPAFSASRIAIDTVLTPDGASDYDIRVTTKKGTDIWTLKRPAMRHIRTLRRPPAIRPSTSKGGTMRSFSLKNIFYVAIVLMVITALFLEVNTYSMHSMYRNRLVRAYLGASRWRRRPHAFTGFDPQDDLQMHQLRPDILWGSSFRDFRQFLRHMQKRSEEIETFRPEEQDEARRGDLWWHLPERVRVQAAMLLEPASAQQGEVLEEVDLHAIVLGAVNDLMHECDFEKGFAPAVPTPALVRRNRGWLDRNFSDCIKPNGRKPPLHLVNIALNLVGGEKLAWQQRKAESFTVSPLHVGSHRLGYRDTREYGGPGGGISLGTAIAISGAAVSPNMGYHSSGAVTALMTLFNARLGWWLGNPGPIGDYTFEKAGPPFALTPLLREAAGMTNDKSSWVFLSDGGHFENLGIYEMVLRRSRYIIVCDATADDKYAFDDLGNAVRKIRIDLGVPIDFDAIHIEPPDPKEPGPMRARKYCALGRIRYSAVDNPSQTAGRDNPEDGWLLYVKPVVYDDCPVDIRNYRKASPTFPHESTGDQFFSETQFESYRALGAHCVEQILGKASEQLSIESFFAAAKTYVRSGETKRNRERKKRVALPTPSMV
jgi:hypothetical protein